MTGEVADERLTIFLVPTRSFSDGSYQLNLVNLCLALNDEIKRNKISCNVRFCVLRDDGVVDNAKEFTESKFFRYIQKTKFQNFTILNRLPLRQDDITNIKSTSIVDMDAFAQLRAFVDKLIDRLAIERHVVDISIIISIGDEIVSEDDPDAEWKGIPEEDAYTCIGDVSLGIYDNDFYRLSRNLFHISLARARSRDVFGDDLKSSLMQAREKRAIIARYIIANLCFALAESLFKKTLSAPELDEKGEEIEEDHRALCVTYQAKIASSERESYYAEGLCQACWSKAQRMGLATLFNKSFHDWKDAVKLISAMMATASDLKRDARLEQVYEKYKDAIFGAVIIGVFVGLLVTYEADRSVWEFLTKHVYAIAGGVIWTLGFAWKIRGIKKRLDALP